LAAFSSHVGDEVVHVPLAVGAHIVAVVDDVDGDSLLKTKTFKIRYFQ
jgi:uncharacterized protein (DUF2141 family)